MPWPAQIESFGAPDWQVLARHWHPVAYSHEVDERPFACRLLDHDLVVFRTEHGVTVARDICLHRGARLSRGTLQADEIICPYHGFRYNWKGACTLIPAQDPKVSISTRLNLKTYPAVERYGLIWTQLDSSAESSPSLPEWPEFNDAAWQIIPMPPAIWNAAATRHVENFNDVAHLSFVHVDTFGNPDEPRIEPYDVKRNGAALSFTISYPQLDRESLAIKKPAVTKMKYEYELTLLFSSRLWIRHPAGRDAILYDIPGPISARKSRIYFFILRNHDKELPVQEYVDFQQTVLDEDQPMVEDQRPEELPLELAEEVHIQADRFSIAFRQALRELGLGRPFSS